MIGGSASVSKNGSCDDETRNEESKKAFRQSGRYRNDLG
jgi:hypothetical protein